MFCSDRGSRAKAEGAAGHYEEGALPQSKNGEIPVHMNESLFFTKNNNYNRQT